MNTVLLGIATATGLLALIPSKDETERDVPFASIGLAILSGVCVAAAGLLHP